MAESKRRADARYKYISGKSLKLTKGTQSYFVYNVRLECNKRVITYVETDRQREKKKE